MKSIAAAFLLLNLVQTSKANYSLQVAMHAEASYLVAKDTCMNSILRHKHIIILLCNKLGCTGAPICGVLCAIVILEAQNFEAFC